jgi:HSP20 family protein
MVLQRWDPAREMRQIDRVMNRLWRGFGRLDEEIENWSIPVDVVQKPEVITVKASLPGVKPEEIDVAVEDNVLSIRGESAMETETEESGYLIRERSSGTFYRAIRLPDSVDTNKIKSAYKDGVLTITMPKAEEKKRKKIKVNVGGSTKTIEAKAKE